MERNGFAGTVVCCEEFPGDGGGFACPGVAADFSVFGRQEEVGEGVYGTRGIVRVVERE